ncbi:MAG: histone deacetylase family protein [Gammaproteobacteria bacterium]|nr:histone deacetylase family protein [Gammaproteobacteria bacterium]
MLVGLISHPLCLKHEMGAHHPECPQRLTAIEDQLIAQGLNMMLRHYDAPAATREQLERVHAPAYVDEIHARAPAEGLVSLDPDTLMNPHSLEAALRAAGSAVLGVDLVMQGEIGAAFCNVRPPGHHAERDRAMGFCLFNNVAVGAAHALAAHGLERVAIVDFDVHHGNGTEHIFAAEPRVLFCSTFQHPFYPHTGAETDTPHIVNVPLPAGADGKAFREAVSAHWLPRLEAFAPEFLFISAGFDGHIEDDMAMLALREDDYRWVTQQIQAVARRHAQGRIVSCLEGGYELHALGRSAFAHIDALVD